MEVHVVLRGTNSQGVKTAQWAVLLLVRCMQSPTLRREKNGNGGNVEGWGGNGWGWGGRKLVREGMTGHPRFQKTDTRRMAWSGQPGIIVCDCVVS